MRKLKKLLAVASVAAMTLSLCACGGKKDDTYTVGICQLVQHEALDAATKGFKDALVEEFGEDGIKFDEQNAQGDANTCATIINGFVSSDVDLILANATPALQAAAAGTDTIPILGTSVTEYGVALEIQDFNGTVGRNISGTSDLAPLESQADMIKAALEKLGYTCEYYSFSDSNDLSTVTTSAANASDVIYVPTDNTVAANTEIIKNICMPAKTPVVAGEEGICKGCGVATLSISYYDLGVATGKMAAKILKGESKVEEMPIEYAPQFTKKYNKDICDELGISVPDDYEAITNE